MPAPLSLASDRRRLGLRASLGAGASLALATCLAIAAPRPAGAAVTLQRVSTDPYTNTTSAHRTEVEPDTFASGSTMVAAFQVGRFFDGGSSNIGWATSADGGNSWTNGFLQGITTAAGGSFDRATDPSVAYDASHGVWLISSLALTSSASGAAIVVSRSTDGGRTWGQSPVVASSAGKGADYDKDWIVCDDTATSPHYGHCYLEWDDFGNGNAILMSTSNDGGRTWSTPAGTADAATGIGGQPVVQPNGNVIVPLADAFQANILAFDSSDGGSTWSASVPISAVNEHPAGGGLRTSPLPSAEFDASGRVYVVWQDCSFRAACAANDIVLARSDDGKTWSQPSRVPIDGLSSGIDHFIPGLAVDRSSSGASARLALTYYYYPQAGCTASTCQLDIGEVGSDDGGATWTSPIQLAGPMQLGWLANTDQGPMVGDYISTSFVAGSARTVIAVAAAPGGTNGSVLDEAMYRSSELPVPSPPAPPGSSAGGLTSASSTPLATPGSTAAGGAGASTDGAGANPAIQGLTLSRARFQAASAGPAVARVTGTTVSYAQSQAGSTSFSVARVEAARGQAGRCRAVRRRNRGRGRCTRLVVLGRGFGRTAVAGINRFRFTGRVAGSTLSPGRYRLTAVPRGAGGQAGAPATVDFAIVRRPAARRAVAVR